MARSSISITPKVSNSKTLPKPTRLPASKTPAVKFKTSKVSNPKIPKPNVSKGLLGYLSGTKYGSS